MGNTLPNASSSPALKCPGSGQNQSLSIAAEAQTEYLPDPFPGQKNRIHAAKLSLASCAETTWFQFRANLTKSKRLLANRSRLPKGKVSKAINFTTS
mmetsp:Transcript_40259/g.96472  ORF Transcript_40259/g.96472 Transcript_40259/m.96472 type:complete len:97 (+) Transcript_40259:1090-1380(+)